MQHIGIDLSAALKTNANCSFFIFFRPIFLSQIWARTHFPAKCDGSAFFHRSFLSRLPCCADWQVATNLDQTFFFRFFHKQNAVAMYLRPNAMEWQKEKERDEKEKICLKPYHMAVFMPKTKCSFTHKKQESYYGILFNWKWCSPFNGCSDGLFFIVRFRYHLICWLRRNPFWSLNSVVVFVIGSGGQCHESNFRSNKTDFNH